MLCDELEKIDKIRILVGLDADQRTRSLAKYSRGVEQLFLPFSNQKAAERIMFETIQEMTETEDTFPLEKGASRVPRIPVARESVYWEIPCGQPGHGQGYHGFQ